MKNRIIEIIELGLPKSLIQRENKPTSELIETNLLVEELNQALRLFAVSGLLSCLHNFIQKDTYWKSCTHCGMLAPLGQ
jgi:hypothetical protein